MSKTSISAKIAEELRKKLGEPKKSFKVKMKYTKEIGEFIKKIEKAQQSSRNSKLKF